MKNLPCPTITDRNAEIREIKLKIENLLVAANYSGLPQEATVAYLKEVQVLRQRLYELGGGGKD